MPDDPVVVLIRPWHIGNDRGYTLDYIFPDGTVGQYDLLTVIGAPDA